MMAAALFVVLFAAKAATLAGYSLPPSGWTPAAYLWHDAALVALFALFEHHGRRRPRFVAMVYAIVAAYIAITIPVVRVLGTPLTVPMWRATGGALSDSIVFYITPGNVAAIGALLLTAFAAPYLTRRARPLLAASAAIFLTILGSIGASKVDTHGLERNAWSALALSALPRVAAQSSDGSTEDWRAPLADVANATDLSWLRGVAADRNVVLVALESTAAQYLGLYGATPDIAPNLSRLAQSAVVFDRAYAVYPESIKGLFATLCSQYPAFDRPAADYAGVSCRSPAMILGERGYHTGLFHAGRFAYLGMNAVIRDRGYDLLADAGDIGGNRESSFGVDEPAVVDFMLRWIDGLQPGGRFFITYLPIAGHHPYESSRTAERFANDTEFDRYRNAIHDGDAALGALIEGVRRRGLAKQTVWIVYGDHGEAFGQHESNYGHTFQLYEENVHVPLLVSLPGVLAEPIRSDRVVSLIDTAPTLLDVAGIAPPVGYQGRTALSGPPAMSLFFADYSLGLLGLRDGPSKFIYEMESGRARLFDVGHDPRETHNLAVDRSAARNEYIRRLTGWIKTASGG
jgi:phosphoglycerol transferase MdoB-like AlkP superfamily enzyme